jgi:hypothetical protein
VGDVYGVAVDASMRKVWLRRNGTWFTAGGSPAAGPGYGLAWDGGVYPYANLSGGPGSVSVDGDSVRANFGQDPFVYTVPDGFDSGICP